MATFQCALWERKREEGGKREERERERERERETDRQTDRQRDRERSKLKIPS